MLRWLRGNPAVVWLGALALALAGLRAIFVLPSSIYPEMTFPRVVVVAHAGQLATELVEARITRPLEEALAVVPGVRHVRARTIRGAVELELQLTDSADPLTTQNACRAAVEQAELPKGTTTRVERVLPTAVPVITFNLAAAKGATADARRLRDVAERIVRPAFVRAGGVGGVELSGGRTREVEIIADPARLAALHLTPSALALKLEENDQLVAAGHVFDEHQTLPIVVDAQAMDLDAIRQLPIAEGPAGPVPLADVAEVIEGAADPEVIVRGPAGETVAISVMRLPGANTTAVVDSIRARAADLRATHALPADVVLEPVYDQAALVDESLASVREAILIGIGLALVVIALALRDVRAGAVAALPVPVTLLGTFAIMQWLGVTLNLMSLGGLAIAIGLVVDDAIVVTEGIVARLEEGHDRATAVELGYRDMFAAVVGTTATTVVVFAPLALLSGMTGSFLGAFAITLAIAVVLSMVTALSLIPIVATRIAARPAARPAAHAAASEDRIGRLVTGLARHRIVAPLVALALLGLGAAAYTRLATGFLPPMDEGAFVVDFFMPPGTSLEETDAIGMGIDRVLAADPAVATFTRRTGTELGPATATQQNRGDVMVALRPGHDDIDDVIERVRAELAAKVPEARIELVQVLQDVLADLAGAPEPIEIRVLGDDPRALDAWAVDAGAKLEKRPELVDFFDGREGQTPILRTTVDPVLVAHLGLDADDLASDIEIAAAGREVAEIVRPERTIGVRLRYPDAIRYAADALARSPIAYGPRALPLGDVAHFSRPLSPAVLHRDGLREALVMHAGTPNGDLGGAEAAVRETLRDVPLPPGAQLEIGGQAATSAAARRELVTVAAIAVVLVLLVLLIQLRSLRYALVVLAAAPLSAAGGLVALAVTHTPLDISSLTGLILLVGLVVKNGILLLEHLQHDLASGMAFTPALVAAARRRLRPILMTTAATLAGLAPLAIGLGTGSELQQPLAIAVVGGLVLATLVTLLVVPGLTALVTGSRARTAAPDPAP
ncbi:MAG TPA: efflux RND transporter permease subunit [Kofleriaceae bacterium]|jgi:multidrug efflux pump subunit AcrB